MSESREEKAEQIFFEAIELPPTERQPFIDRQCGDDRELRALVDSLLAADEAAGDANFLESHFLTGASLGFQADTPGSRSAEPTPMGADAGSDPDSPPASRRDSQVAQDASPQPDSRFRILSRYEQGGLGEVLIAHDGQLNREVAVKQIRLKWQANAEARERFLQEAEVTGRLEHPGIVPVYALGTWEDGRPFYAMRFIQGKTLKQVITEWRESGQSIDPQAKRMELRGLLNRFVDVCNTIEYAHSRRILHRDIKPSNIMIGPYGETLVVDWGLAKLLDAPLDESMTAALVQQYAKEGDSSRTQIGGAVGTPQYMSPEQASGDLESIGVRTDVYLLGATLYQVLTGVPPHQGSSISELIERVKRGILIRPKQVDPDVPSALDAICVKAMSVKAADRYRSATELSADIERWLADQPVSVFRDPFSVRWGRWIRRHRTVAMSGTVAAILLTFGSILGSAIWNYERARQFEVEQERNLKETQLAASRQLRLGELRDSAESAMQLSQREIESNRFPSALALLRRAAESLSDEPSLADQQSELLAKAGRLERIVEFHRQAELSEQFNVSSRDTQGILASSAALKVLGVWDHHDWWTRLPDQDLTPAQKDKLRWDAYQQWMMLNGMLVKTIGTKLFGNEQSGMIKRVFTGLRRLSTDAGKREATTALVVSDRIDWFRRSETAKWYRGIANDRLKRGERINGKQLGTPRNAPDAQKLGVLCMIAAMDPTFAIVFGDYMGQDATIAARDLFQRSSSLRPDHYWTQIALGQMQYFLAEKESDPTWESYQPAVLTMGRCIAIDPESCFAYADRASLFRFQWQCIQTDERLSESEKDQRAAELLHWSLQDAQTAYQLGTDQPWVGWTYGMSLAAARQTEKAIKILLEASERTLPLMQIADATLIRADDIRGRSDAAQYAAEWIERDQDNPIFRTLLASIRLNQQDDDASLEQIESVMGEGEASAHAHAVRGMIRLHRDDIDAAASDFRIASERNPLHLWARYGAAACLEAKEEFEPAIEGFRQAMTLATTNEHRAACLIGIFRSAGALYRFDEAIEAVTSAQQLQPAYDLGSVAKALLDRYKSLRVQPTAELRDFLVALDQLIRSKQVGFATQEDIDPFDAAVLNGDFELGALRYWSHASGITWRNELGYGGTAEVTSEESHRGDYSLRIAGDRVEETGQQGASAQTFPVPASCHCKLSVWARSSGLESGALRLRVEPFVELELPAGVYDWREFAVEFDVGDPPDPFRNVVPLTVEIVSAGPGEAFLDDLRVTVTPSP